MLQNDFKGPVGDALSGGIAVKEEDDRVAQSRQDAGVFIGQGRSQRAYDVGVSGLVAGDDIRIAFRRWPMGLHDRRPGQMQPAEGASLVEHFCSGLLRYGSSAGSRIRPPKARLAGLVADGEDQPVSE